MIIWTRFGILGILIPGALVFGFEGFAPLDTPFHQFWRATAAFIGGMIVIVLGTYLNRWNYKKIIDRDGEEIKHAVFGAPMEWIGYIFTIYGAFNLIGFFTE